MMAMITQPIESSQIAEATMICPRLRRVKPISRTIAATILIEEMDNAVPRNREVSRRWSGCGSSESGSNWPRMKPQMKGTATPVTEMLSAALPTVRTSLRSVSMPVSNSSKRMPNWEMPSSMAFCSGALGKMACCKSGHSAPNTDGPSMMPPSSMPITDGWPMRFMASPKRRPTTISVMSWARKMTSEAPPLPPSAAILALMLGAGPSFAAEGGKGGASEVIFLAQLITLMVVGRLLGEAMNRIGQPSVMGMLLGGIMLGPSVFGALWPDLQHAIFPSAPEQKAMLDGISQFGILLLLLLTGMETDLKPVQKVGRAALSISVTGVAVPFICGFILGQLLPDSLLPHPDHRLLTSLFPGTALSISSIKIVAAIVREMGFTRRNLGQIIVASAICEDSIGWVIIAIIFGLAQAGTIDLMSVAKSVLGTAVFLIASFTVERRIVYFLIRWTNDNFESDFPVVTTILVIMGAMALTTHFIGVHTVLGAFVAGVLIGEAPILSKHIDEQLRGLILAF